LSLPSLGSSLISSPVTKFLLSLGLGLVAVTLLLGLGQNLVIGLTFADHSWLLLKEVVLLLTILSPFVLSLCVLALGTLTLGSLTVLALRLRSISHSNNLWHVILSLSVLALRLAKVSLSLGILTLTVLALTVLSLRLRGTHSNEFCLAILYLSVLTLDILSPVLALTILSPVLSLAILALSALLSLLTLQHGEHLLVLLLSHLTLSGSYILFSESLELLVHDSLLLLSELEVRLLGVLHLVSDEVAEPL